MFDFVLFFGSGTVVLDLGYLLRLTRGIRTVINFRWLMDYTFQLQSSLEIFFNDIDIPKVFGPTRLIPWMMLEKPT